MANPLAQLSPALELLGNSLNILPATGSAVEDLQHPDVDEKEDALINRDVGEASQRATGDFGMAALPTTGRCS